MASCIRRVVSMVANLSSIVCVRVRLVDRGLVKPELLAPGLVDPGLDDVVEVGPGLVVGPALIHVCVRRLSRVPKNLVSLEWGCASFTDRAFFALFV